MKKLGDDPTKWTEEECDDFAVVMAVKAFESWNAFTAHPAICGINAVGIMVERVFQQIQFDTPAQRVEEFDNWCKYTRGRMVDEMKKRLS